MNLSQFILSVNLSLILMSRKSCQVMATLGGGTSIPYDLSGPLSGCLPVLQCLQLRIFIFSLCPVTVYFQLS
jgi:hypothetical protein